MSDIASGSEIPVGLRMALVQNLSAMQYFADLPTDERQQIVTQAHGIQSKQEMQTFVQSLAERS